MSVAALTASVAENVVTYPLETWKIHRQLQLNAQRPASYPKFTLSGLSPHLYGNVARTLTRYAVYDNMHASPGLVAGLACAVSETMVVVPFENLKTRMLALDTHMHTRALAAHVMRTEGVLALFRGTLATYARQFCASSVRFSLYYFQQSSIWALGATAFAECLVSQPLDVIKTRRQCALPVQPRQTIRSLYAGLVPRTLRKWIGTVVVVSVYNRLNYDNDVVNLF